MQASWVSRQTRERNTRAVRTLSDLQGRPRRITARGGDTLIAACVPGLSIGVADLFD
jgi:hypothetical protein